MIPIEIGLDSEQFEKQVKQLANIIEKTVNNKTVTVDVKSNAKEVTSDIKAIPDTKKVEIKADSSSVDKADSKVKAIPDKKKVDVKVNVDASGIEDLKASMNELGGGATEAMGGLFDAFKTGGVIGAGIAAATLGIQAIGGAISSLIGGGFELNNAFKDLQAQTGASDSEMVKLKATAKDVFVGGIGGSVAEAVKVLSEAQKIFGKAFNPDELGKFVMNAGALGKTLDLEVNEVLQKSQTFVKSFGLSGEKAFELLSIGAKEALTPSNDFMDTIAEYSPLFTQAGYSAEQMVQTITEASQKGAFSTDFIGDAIKESQIRLKAGDAKKAFTDFGAELPANLKKNLLAAEALASQNKISVKSFLSTSSKEIEQAFSEGKISEALRSQLQVAIVGTKAEDLGSEVTANLLSGTAKSDKQINERAKQIAGDISKQVGAYTSFEAIGKQASATFQMIGLSIIEFAEKYISPFLGAVINGFQEIGTELSPMWNNIMDGMKPIVSFLYDVVWIAFKNNWNSIKEIISAVIGTVLYFYEQLYGSLKPLFTALQSVFDLFKSSETGLTSWYDILGSIWDIIKIVGKVLIDLLMVPINLIIGVVTFAINIFSKLFGSMDSTKASTKALSVVMDSLGKILTNIKGTLGGLQVAFVVVKTVIGDFFNALATLDIKKILNSLSGFGEKIANGYNKGFNEAIGKTGDGLDKNLDKTKEKIGAAFGDMQTKIDELGASGKTGKALEADAKILLGMVNSSQNITAEQKKQLTQQLNSISVNKVIAKDNKSVQDDLQKQIDLMKKQNDEAQALFETKQNEKLLVEKRALNDDETLARMQNQIVLNEKLLQKTKDVYTITDDNGSIKVGVTINDATAKQDIETSFAAAQKGLTDLQLAFTLKGGDLTKGKVEKIVKDTAELFKATQEKNKELFTVDAVVKAGLDIDTFKTSLATQLSLLDSQEQLIKDAIVLNNGVMTADMTAQLKAITDERVLLQKDENLIISTLKIGAITDLAEQEKQLAILNLNEKFKAESILYKNNNAKLLQIQSQYTTDLLAINQKYAKESSGLFDNIFASVSNTLSNFKFDIIPKIDQDAKQKALDSVTEIETKISELNNPKNDGDLLSYKDFKKTQEQLKKDLEVAKKEFEKYNQDKIDIFSSAEETMRQIFQQSIDFVTSTYQSSYQKQLTDLQAFNLQRTTLIEAQKDNEEQLQKAYDDNDFEKAYDLMNKKDALDVSEKKNEENRLKTQTKATEDLLYAQGLAYLGVLATGKSTFEDLGKFALDTLLKLIPIYIVDIFAKSIQWLGPIAGPIVATGLIGTLLALRANIGAEDGVIGISQNYNKKAGSTDTIPLWVAPNESIINAKSSQKHSKLLSMINNNASDKELSNYFVNTQGVLKSPKLLVNNIQNNNSNFVALQSEIYGLRQELQTLKSIDKKLSHATLVQSVRNENINITNKTIQSVKSRNFLG